RPVIGLPVWLGYPGVWLLGKILGEPLATREEITALTSGLLTGGLQPRTLPASGLHSGEEPACQLHAGAESPPTQGADRTETPATQPGASPASAKTCTADAEPSVKTSTKAAPCDSIIAPESVITPTSITVWMAQNADSLGRHFIAETGRRKDRIKAY
ncbi:hypothetical protein LJC48_07695, partial [Desulfovibrio sp. OttesenSCG-928-C06]|nr:hypothetical protein [Desulfovibrio sp. OttesenSCG-928-C06]